MVWRSVAVAGRPTRCILAGLMLRPAQSGYCVGDARNLSSADRAGPTHSHPLSPRRQRGSAGWTGRAGLTSVATCVAGCSAAEAAEPRSLACAHPRRRARSPGRPRVWPQMSTRSPMHSFDPEMRSVRVMPIGEVSALPDDDAPYASRRRGTNGAMEPVRSLEGSSPHAGFAIAHLSRSTRRRRWGRLRGLVRSLSRRRKAHAYFAPIRRALGLAHSIRPRPPAARLSTHPGSHRAQRVGGCCRRRPVSPALGEAHRSFHVKHLHPDSRLRVNLAESWRAGSQGDGLKFRLLLSIPACRACCARDRPTGELSHDVWDRPVSLVEGVGAAHHEASHLYTALAGTGDAAEAERWPNRSDIDGAMFHVKRSGETRLPCFFAPVVSAPGGTPESGETDGCPGQSACRRGNGHILR